MAKVEWSAGIDTVSGALAKPGKNPQHSCQKMLLGTHRVAETTSNDCNRLYLRRKVQRKSALSQTEKANRIRFKTVAQAVAERRMDLSKMTTDQEAFLAQRDEPNGKRTMRSYLWKLEMETYDAAHPNG
ncbi:MAG: hypothetical protein II901_00145 [Paludibacteraceae bacterium]|nr:hypothetical protein [Paludibacteraceae bacterium]